MVNLSQDSIASIMQEENWNLDRFDQAGLPLNGVYDSSPYDGSGVDVYVIDTGVDILHSEFEGRASAGAEFGVEGDFTARISHGTHVAGIVGGKTYGVAKGARIVDVRLGITEDLGIQSSSVVQGIDWACNQAVSSNAVGSVLNLSLGGSYSEAENMAVGSCVARGVVVVVAAGNQQSDACYVSPASAASAITVAASEIEDSLFAFSNVGECVGE
jgi:subtilisin family serine protease